MLPQRSWCIFKESIFVSSERSGSLAHLKGADGGALETKVGLEVLGDLPDQPLEGQLADQQLSGLLVATDLTQSHGSRSGEEDVFSTKLLKVRK